MKWVLDSLIVLKAKCTERWFITQEKKEINLQFFNVILTELSVLWIISNYHIKYSYMQINNLNAILSSE